MTEQPRIMLHHIVLQLARCAEFLEGNTEHGYEIVAPPQCENLTQGEQSSRCRDGSALTAIDVTDDAAIIAQATRK